MIDTTMATPAEKQFLIDRMMATKAIVQGDFTLASGVKSNVYLDCRMLTLDSKSLPRIIEMMVRVLDFLELEPNRIGGMSAGADPLVAGFMGHGWRNMKGFFVRKEPKQHGTCKLVEGHLAAGDKVIIVDDVATSGNSLVRVAQEVTLQGGQVLCAIAIVDRKEGAKETLQGMGIPLYSLISLWEVCHYAKPRDCRRPHNV